MTLLSKLTKKTKIIMISRTIGELLFLAIVLAVEILPLTFRASVAFLILLGLLLGWIFALTDHIEDKLFKDISYYLEQTMGVIIFLAMAYIAWPYLGFGIMFGIFPTIVVVTIAGRFKKGLIISSLYVAGYAVLYFFLPQKPLALPYFIGVPMIMSVSVSAALLVREIERLTITDNLTSLYNRRYFQEVLDDYAGPKMANKVFSVLIIDVDDFKKYNDTLGHLEGDRILKTIAQSMTKIMRESDILARYGGEEFIAILPKTDLKGAKAVAEKVRHAVADNKDLPKVTVSIGVSMYPGNGADTEEILKMADEAMYTAKKSGKNRVQLAIQ